MDEDVNQEPYEALAVHNLENESSSIELELVPNNQAKDAIRLSSSGSIIIPQTSKTDIFRNRMKYTPTQQFRINQPSLQYFYPPFQSKAPEFNLNLNNRMTDYIARKQTLVSAPKPELPSTETLFKKNKTNINIVPTKQPEKQQTHKKQQKIPPPFKTEKKAQKSRLKNLEKYRNIQIRQGDKSYQQRLQRAVQEKLKRQYGNILALDRRKAYQKKLTDEQIKVWLKSDKEAVKVDNKPLALCFMNEHINSYAPLVRVILSHSFGQQLLQPQCKKIPTIFPEKDTYQKTFQFLIFNQAIASLHSCYQQFQKSENSRRPVRVMIKAGATNEDGFFTFFMKQDIKSVKDTEQRGQNVNIMRNLSLSKFNLVIISDSSEFNPRKYSTKDFSNGFTFVTCLLSPESKEQLAADIRLISMVNGNKFIRKRTESWIPAYAFIFQKISTFVKEFLAVRNVQFSDLADYIYNPPLMTKSNPTYVSRPECFDKFFNRLQTIYNKTQFGSVRELSLRDKGIIMLQGPPGTGKTSTLLGVLAGQYHYLKQLNLLGLTKILVCTPSNTAIDHITKRIVTEGLMSTQDENVYPKVLRMGLVDSDSEAVRSVYLDYLCQKELIESNKELAQKIKWTIPEIKDKITFKLKQIKRVESALKTNHDPQLEQKLRKLIDKKNDLEQMAYQLRRKRIDDKSTYSQIQKRLISEAQIILTTLSSSGSERLEKLKGQFACLIVDEAGQCTEPNLLISLQLNINKILLIGDPCQLPATTFSPDSNITLFNRSMFERMIDAGLKPYFLDIQYRMTPQIRFFPSRVFYNGRLIDDQSIMKRSYPHQISRFKDTNVFFIDVKFGSERQVEKSYENEGQIEVTTALIEELRAPQLNIGIITPYKQQMRRLQNTLRHQSHVFINTIDSFQGQQKDIILISTVRASSRVHFKSLGFLIDQRRINVALTRSKFLLIVIGSADTLGSNEIWNEFLKLMENQKRYMKLENRENYRQGLRRLLKGELTQKDQQCKRRRYTEFTRDQRKGEREEINLSDFIQPGQVKSSQHIEQVVAPQIDSSKNNMIPPPIDSDDKKDEDKWCVSAAKKNFDRILKQMYGEKSIVDILKDLK